MCILSSTGGTRKHTCSCRHRSSPILGAVAGRSLEAVNVESFTPDVLFAKNVLFALKPSAEGTWSPEDGVCALMACSRKSARSFCMRASSAAVAARMRSTSCASCSCMYQRVASHFCLYVCVCVNVFVCLSFFQSVCLYGFLRGTLPHAF